MAAEGTLSYCRATVSCAVAVRSTALQKHAAVACPRGLRMHDVGWSSDRRGEGNAAIFAHSPASASQQSLSLSSDLARCPASLLAAHGSIPPPSLTSSHLRASAIHEQTPPKVAASTPPSKPRTHRHTPTHPKHGAHYKQPTPKAWSVSVGTSHPRHEHLIRRLPHTSSPSAPLLAPFTKTAGPGVPRERPQAHGFLAITSLPTPRQRFLPRLSDVPLAAMTLTSTLRPISTSDATGQ